MLYVAKSAVTSLEVLRIVCVATMFGVAPSFAAGNVTSVRDLPDELKNVRQGRLSNADITLLNVRIGRETITEVQSRFGAADSFRNPPRGDSSDVEICYASQRAGKLIWIIFGSSAMGGWKTVTHFQVLSEAPKDAPCTHSALEDRPITTRSGIRLGMQLKSLHTKFGRSTEQGAGYAVFGFEQKSDHPERRNFDMLSALRTTTKNERLTSFHVLLIESN